MLKRVTTTIKTQYTLHEHEVETIIRMYLGLDDDATVEFNIGGSGFLRDEAVTVTTRTQDTQDD